MARALRGHRAGIARSAALALVLGLVPAAAHAQGMPRFQVEGQVSTEGSTLIAEVTLRNTGPVDANGVKLQGEIGGDRQEASAALPVPSRGAVVLTLRFAPRGLGAGVHFLPLLIEFSPLNRPDLATSQRAWLLVALGAAAKGGVNLSLADGQLVDEAWMTARVSSLDGRPHQVAVRLVPPNGLQAPDPPKPVSVPATGTADVPLRILRGGAPRPSQQGVVVVAEWDEGGLHGAAAASGLVQLRPDPAWIPRARVPLLVAALLLVGAAAGVEIRAAWRRRRARFVKG